MPGKPGPNPTDFSAKADRLNRAPHSGHSINLPRPLIPNKRSDTRTTTTTRIAPIMMYKPFMLLFTSSLILLLQNRYTRKLVNAKIPKPRYSLLPFCQDFFPAERGPCKYEQDHVNSSQSRDDIEEVVRDPQIYQADFTCDVDSSKRNHRQSSKLLCDTYVAHLG